MENILSFLKGNHLPKSAGNGLTTKKTAQPCGWAVFLFMAAGEGFEHSEQVPFTA
jgi:hypothetical protein